jgi:hypothetical protein
MTILELAERDLRKALRAHLQARKTPNIPEEQLKHTKELLDLRKQIVIICAKARVENDEQG